MYLLLIWFISLICSAHSLSRFHLDLKKIVTLRFILQILWLKERQEHLQCQIILGNEIISTKGVTGYKRYIYI